MASNKKINVPISALPSHEIYALLDTIESDDEEDIENFMNDSDTEFIDESGIEVLDNSSCESRTASGTYIIQTTTPIEAVVRAVEPEDESEDDALPLSNLVSEKKFNWKWRKQYNPTAVKACTLAEEGILNIVFESPSPLQIFSETVGLEGLLTLIKTESERYAEQSVRTFQTSTAEISAFLGKNILMGIHKLPSMKDYWSVEEGLGNILIQNTMTRSRFLEILQNLHFANNLQELPPKESESYDRAWKLRPLFEHLGHHFKQACQPESHQSVDEHMCKFKGKSMMRQYMKNKPIKWGFKF